MSRYTFEVISVARKHVSVPLLPSGTPQSMHICRLHQCPDVRFIPDGRNRIAFTCVEGWCRGPLSWVGSRGFRGAKCKAKRVVLLVVSASALPSVGKSRTTNSINSRSLSKHSDSIHHPGNHGLRVSSFLLQFSDTPRLAKGSGPV